MRMLFLSVAIALGVTAATHALVPVSASAAVADSKGKTRKEFQSFWQERLNEYVAQQNALAAKHKEAVEAFIDPPFVFAPGDERLEKFAAATLADGEVSGRGMLLESFLEHMEGRPSVGLTRAWLQSQFDVVQNTSADADKLERDARAILDKPDAHLFDLIAAMELALLRRGAAIGRAKELILLSDNFLAYSSEFAQASARDQETRQRIGAALSAMGAALQNNRTWMAQCHTVGPTISCMGQ